MTRERLVTVALVLVWVSWALWCNALNVGCNRNGVRGTTYYGAILHASGAGPIER